jgi:hypothetical protein
MMLGQPIAMIAAPFGGLRQIDGIAHRVGGGAAGGNGRLVENG